MYRTICCELWTDEKVQALSAHEKLLFLYLITNPHSHMSGIYYLPTVFMQHEVNLGRGFDGAWKGLLKSELVEADERRSQVWVVNMLPYQAKGNKSEKGVASHLNTLHISPLIDRFLTKYPQIVEHLSSDFIRCPIDTPLIPHTKVPSSVPVPDPDSVPSLVSKEGKESEKGEFDVFWIAFPNKTGKDKAREVWNSVKNKNRRPPLADVLAAIERAKLSKKWTKDDGQYIPNPATWLNQGRWDDEPPEVAVPKDPNGFLAGMQAFLERGE